MVALAHKTRSVKPKVIICGGGIGGLTVAHELAKHNVSVVVYERNETVGGLARSRYYTDPRTKETYPTEYSWRIYGTHYKNLLRILGEIPRDAGGSVMRNLVTVWTYVFARFDKPEVVVTNGKNVKQLLADFAPSDRRKILNKILYCLTMSTERMDQLDKTTWKDFCSDLSPEAQKYLVRMWGPVLGMDPTRMSFGVIARMVVVLLGAFFGSTGSLFVLNKPTNDGWFSLWTNHLEKSGKVTIKTNHVVQSMQLADGRVQSVMVKDMETGELVRDDAEYVVCSMPVEAVAELVRGNPALAAVPTLQNTVALAAMSRQVQLSVQIFLRDKLRYPSDKPLVLYLPDTPWAIIIEPQDVIWGQTYSSNNKVKTVLSVGICQTDAPGILHKKPFVRCTQQEIQEEVWAQITRSYKRSSIVTQDGEPFESSQVELFYMWESFVFDPSKKEITVWEPV